MNFGTPKRNKIKWKTIKIKLGGKKKKEKRVSNSKVQITSSENRQICSGYDLVSPGSTEQGVKISMEHAYHCPSKEEMCTLPE